MTNRASTETSGSSVPGCCAYHGAGGDWYQGCGEVNRLKGLYGMPYFPARLDRPGWSSCPECGAAVRVSAEAREVHLLGVCAARPRAAGPRASAERVLEEGYGQVAEGQERRALRMLFSAVDGALLRGSFPWCEQVLAGADPTRLGVLCATGLLAVTLRARGKLPGRAGYLGRVRAYLEGERPGQVRALLAGLG